MSGEQTMLSKLSQTLIAVAVVGGSYYGMSKLAETTYVDQGLAYLSNAASKQKEIAKAKEEAKLAAIALEKEAEMKAAAIKQAEQELAAKKALAEHEAKKLLDIQAEKAKAQAIAEAKAATPVPETQATVPVEVVEHIQRSINLNANAKQAPANSSQPVVDPAMAKLLGQSSK